MGTSLLTSDACGPALPKAEGGTWACTFVDHFEGGALDPEKWLAGETVWSGFRTGDTCYTDSPANLAVRHGQLHLVTRDVGRPFLCRSPKGSFPTRYTGGHVTTRDRFSQAFGRFEARLRFPEARTPGVHGAFWMYPSEETYGPWPRSGEIDVAEWWSARPTSVLPSLHFAGRDAARDTGWRCRVGDPSRPHVYTLEWEPAQMRFSIDGRVCHTATWSPDHPLRPPQPFDHAFNLVLSMGVGSTTDRNAVTASTRLPAHFVVDYVKAWE